MRAAPHPICQQSTSRWGEVDRGRTDSNSSRFSRASTPPSAGHPLIDVAEPRPRRCRLLPERVANRRPRISKLRIEFLVERLGAGRQNSRHPADHGVFPCAGASRYCRGDHLTEVMPGKMRRTAWRSHCCASMASSIPARRGDRLSAAASGSSDRRAGTARETVAEELVPRCHCGDRECRPARRTRHRGDRPPSCGTAAPVLPR